MPIPGTLAPKGRRCLENMAVTGPINALELNVLDPTAPDHQQTIKGLANQGYVIAAFKLNRNVPTSYSLTEKARRLLSGTSTKPAKGEAKAVASKRRITNGTTVGPIIHGSMTTQILDSPCRDMLAPATRPGAEQALQIPSRVNDVLHYRDGRRACIHTNRDL